MLKAAAVLIIAFSVADHLLWGGQIGAAAAKVGWSMLQSFRIL